MLDFYDGPQLASGRSESCKPNYEELALSLKKRISIFEALDSSLTQFIDLVGLGWFGDSQERRSAVIIAGGLKLEIPKMVKEYEKILEKIEE